VVIDVGTGDGRFVYQSAHANPNKFFIGIDASPRPLEKVSEKIYRKPSKGGLSNVLFIQAAVDNLPRELDGLANGVHIYFPWGSLLQAVAMGSENALRNLRRISAPACELRIIIGLDPERDRSEIKRLGLKSLSADFVDGELAQRYQASGFALQESGVIAQSEWPHLETSWSKRLRGNQDRVLIYIIARAAA
jgi:16S rRNA (adenine(1408)-N(1))-methyltransferase